MAKTLRKSTISFTILSIFIFQLLIAAAAAANATVGNHFSRQLSPTKLKLRKEKLSHFRVYFHEVVTGLNPTAVFVLRPPTNTTTGFGSIAMIDNALTMGIELNSKLVGRAQGLYSSAAQTETSLLMVMNFVFVEGKYNGSTISILGRNAVMSTVREMPIIGGSGLFRFARGYVLAKTRRFNMSSGDATVEYNVYVLHY